MASSSAGLTVSARSSFANSCDTDHRIAGHRMAPSRDRQKNSTGANRGNGDRKENLCSLRFLLFKSRSGFAADKSELRERLVSWLREYKCDAEIGLFSEEV